MKLISRLAIDDAATAVQICIDRGWNLQEAAWLASYKIYTARKGNPKRLKKAVILPDIEKHLYDLYDGPEGKHIAEKIRDSMGEGACPMCGSLSTGTVDHFLPRKEHPEYSILTLNLVPACALCNMFTKRRKYMGNLPRERLLHPFFDRLLDHPIWKVQFSGYLKAVKFKAVPVSSLSRLSSDRVAFHLKTVLGREFHKTMRALWRNHAEGVAALADAKGLKRLTRAFLVAQTKAQLTYVSVGGNHNGWTSAFLRGVLEDDAAIDFLRRRGAEHLAVLRQMSGLVRR